MIGQGFCHCLLWLLWLYNVLFCNEDASNVAGTKDQSEDDAASGSHASIGQPPMTAMADYVDQLMQDGTNMMNHPFFSRISSLPSLFGSCFHNKALEAALGGDQSFSMTTTASDMTWLFREDDDILGSDVNAAPHETDADLLRVTFLQPEAYKKFIRFLRTPPSSKGLEVLFSPIKHFGSSLAPHAAVTTKKPFQMLLSIKCPPANEPSLSDDSTARIQPFLFTFIRNIKDMWCMIVSKSSSMDELSSLFKSFERGFVPAMKGDPFGDEGLPPPMSVDEMKEDFMAMNDLICALNDFKVTLTRESQGNVVVLVPIESASRPLWRIASLDLAILAMALFVVMFLRRHPGLTHQIQRQLEPVLDVAAQLLKLGINVIGAMLAISSEVWTHLTAALGRFVYRTLAPVYKFLGMSTTKDGGVFRMDQVPPDPSDHVSTDAEEQQSLDPQLYLFPKEPIQALP